MSSEIERSDDRLLLDFMCRHLVVLCADYQYLVDGLPHGEEQSAICSGFVIEIGRRWCYTTAGHTFHDAGGIGDLIRQGRIQVTRCRLYDFFGPNPVVREPTPFDLNLDHVAYVHSPENSLDFAIVPLEDFYAQSLRANNIVPINRENWHGSDQIEFEGYGIVGAPAPARGELGIRPTFVPIRRITELPENIVQPAEGWFTGQVNIPFDMRGMSGSPIFGFNKLPNGQIGYRTVAIQSGWYPDPQIILGCPVPRFMELVEESIRQILLEQS